MDSHSKWVEVEKVKSTDARTTIRVLRKLFATHGVPRVIVSDNGSGFASTELAEFFRQNGVRHTFAAPYHPSSNGQAERFVRIFKESLKTLKEGDLETKLCRFLFRYRITPQTTTGLSPSELLFNRRVRSALSQMQPDVQSSVRLKQNRGPEASAARAFAVGDDVLVSNFGGDGGKWIRGLIAEVAGSANYRVKLEDGRVVHRHTARLCFIMQPMRACRMMRRIYCSRYLHHCWSSSCRVLQLNQLFARSPSMAKPLARVLPRWS